MKTDEGRIMTKRLPVSDETHIRFRDFARGLDTTMDDAINFLLDLVSESDNPEEAGRALLMKRAELLSKKPVKKKAGKSEK